MFLGKDEIIGFPDVVYSGYSGKAKDGYSLQRWSYCLDYLALVIVLEGNILRQYLRASF